MEIHLESMENNSRVSRVSIRIDVHVYMYVVCLTVSKTTYVHPTDYTRKPQHHTRIGGSKVAHLSG
jgi:hypothetical protein